MRYRFFFLAFLSPFFLYSQTFDWWKNNVNWDGVSHWSRYLIVSPKYLGPNALTVPQINNGSIDSICSLGITANAHFSNGDNTQNITLYGNYTTKNNTISVDAAFIPYERYKMSHQVKTERKTFYLNYDDKQCAGDVVANTTLHLFQNKRDKIQLALRLGVRMPSGGDLATARYADVPGYWIDMGAGIPLKNKAWKWLGMLGFYVWQTNDDKHRQDDALLFGSGIEWNRLGLRMQVYAAGYTGYKNNGDRPTLLRLNIEKRKNRKIYIFRLQQGLQDFAYLSAEAGAKFILGR